MNHARLRRTSGILAGLALATLWGAPTALAIPSVVFQQANGQDSGPQEENGGPGNEQGDITYIEKDGKVYVVSIYMSSKVSNGYWQCKCSSVELSADAAPKVVADQVQLTDNEGERPCNHPRVASNGSTVMFLYGSDKADQAHTQTYATAVDNMCNMVSETRRVSNNGNNNEGAPAIVHRTGEYFSAGYLSTGENDTSIAIGLKLVDLGGGQYDIERTYLEGVVTPANIGRPTIVKMDDQYSLFCAAKGNNRPPEHGVQCAVVDDTTGTVMFKQLIAASIPDEKIYMNQPTVVDLGNNKYALHVLESSGEGKTDNKKGSNIAHDYIISPLTDSFEIISHEVGLGNYPTHSTTCAGAYGMDGVRHFASFGAAITGNSQPLMQFFSHDTAIRADAAHNTWTVGWYADTGKLANLYGPNPHQQGRDFLRCVGDIPNPAYGKPAGFLPSVKTFFAVPHSGRIPGEMKNSQWLTLVPGWTSVQTEPDPPADVNDVELGPQGEGPVDSEPPPASDPEDPPPSPDDNEPGVVNPQNQGGCACSTPDSGSGTTNGLGLMALAIGLALGARRRKGG